MDYFDTVEGRTMFRLLSESVERIAQALEARGDRGGVVDPKGHIVAGCKEGSYYDTLVHMPENKVTPWVLVHGYDRETGEWRAGSYYADPFNAWSDLDPNIVATATVEREDVADVLREFGAAGNDANIDAVIADAAEWMDAAKQEMEGAFKSYVRDEVAALVGDGRLQEEDA